MIRLAVIASLSALALAACGVEGNPRPPEGEEAQYTYPQAYPAPQSVVPRSKETKQRRSRLQPRKDSLDDPFGPRTTTIEPVE